MDGSSIPPEKSEIALNPNNQDIQINHPQISERIAQLEVTVRDLNPEVSLGSNPFSQSDRHPERDERFMGQERRTPGWVDIGTMVRACEEDNREYGMATTRDPEDLNPPLLEYLRGVEHSIYNGGGRTRPSSRSVFFHAHPSHGTPEGELTSIIVSNGDLDAMTQDFGGGYLNIANINGVTLHSGSSEITDLQELLEIRAENSSRIQRQIETGQLKGLKVSTPSEVIKALKRLSETGLGLPFVYSMSDQWMNVRYYFIHIPWDHINRNVSFYDLCFNDGLTRISEGIEGLYEVPVSNNLCQAMIATRQVERRILDKKFEEQRQRVERLRQNQNKWSKLLRWLKIRQ